MIELLREAISWPNLPFTCLLGVVLLYWAFVALGLLEMDTESGHAGDFGHVGADLAHGGIDVGHHGMDMAHGAAHPAHIDHADMAHSHGGETDAADAHAQMERTSILHGGLFRPLLQFLNIGDVPLTIVASFFVMGLWAWSLLLNHYFNWVHSDLRAAALLAPNILATCVATRYVTMPFKKLFRSLNREVEQHKPVVGRVCTILTSEATENFGQAQVETDGAPLVINVRTFGDCALSKGEQALIIKENPETQIYTIAKLNLKPQEKELC